MNDVSTFRLYVLRATYLLIVVGLGVMIWPGVINAPTDLEHMRGVVRALLAGVSVMALLGLRYPLQMLPLLLFEFTWKAIWVLAIGLPLRAADAFTPGTLSTWNDCLVSFPIFLVAIPWGYVWRNYVLRPADRWKGPAAQS